MSLDAIFNEDCDVLSSGSAKRRFPQNSAVNNRAIVGNTIAVVVHSRRAVERSRGGELRQRAGGEVEWEAVAKRDYRAMSLIDHTRPTFFFTQAGNDALVWSDAVAVRFAGVGRFGKRVAKRSVEALITAVNEIRLQTVVVSGTKVHQHINLANTTGDWSYRTRLVGLRHIRGVIGGDREIALGHGQSALASDCSIKRRWGIQINGAVSAGQVLVHEIRSEEQSLDHFAFRADRENLTTRID